MHITIQSILFAVCFLGFILAEETPNVSDLEQTRVTQPSANPLLIKRPKHSLCYNYFLDQDNCVHSAAKSSERCPAENCGREVPKDIPQVFKAHTKSSTSKLLGVDLNKEGVKVEALKRTENEDTTEVPSSLVRRYDSELDSFTIAGGNGICGQYTPDQPGVCLWASSQDSGAAGAGWLNGTFTKACGRMIYIQRQGDPYNTIYAPVVDGCTFDTNATDPGCFRIAFTQKTFNELKPTAEEASRSIIDDLVWDFDNIQGDKPKNAAP